MPGRWFSELFRVGAEQNGFITTHDVRELGGTPQVLVDMHRHGHLDRVAHGLYRFRAFPAGPLDELMQATLWPRRQGVISHDSALDLWDLCDVNPTKVHDEWPCGALEALAHSHGRHADADNPAGARPGLGLDVGPDGPRQQEASRPGIRVDGSLHRAEDGRDLLPLVKRDRLVEARQCRVRISLEGGRFCGSVEANEARGVPRGRRRLSRSARSDHEDRRQLGEELTQ